MKIEIFSVIDAPADKVWKTVRSFENPERFVPIVTSSSIKSPNTKSGVFV